MRVKSQFSDENAENVVNAGSEDFFDFLFKDDKKAVEERKASFDEFTDFMEALSDDVPELTQEETDKEIEKILEKIHPSQADKSKRYKKLSVRVLLVAAILFVLSISCIGVIGKRHNVSIENGFVTFAKDTVKIVFFGENEESISVDALLADLEANGYKDLLFPDEFLVNSDEYDVSIPRYLEGEVNQVNIDIYSSKYYYMLSISEYYNAIEPFNYIDINKGKTITVGDTTIYIFDFDETTTIEYFYKGYRYYICSNAKFSDMLKIAESIK